MAVLTETQLVYLFAGLLAVSAVLLLFIPVLRRAWIFAATPIGFAIVVAPIVVLSIGAIALMALAISDPTYFLPIVAVTVALRFVSPLFIYRRMRAWFEGKRGWSALRLLLLAGFLALAGYLVYESIVVASGSQTQGVVSFSGSLVMAFGASFGFVRFALRARPQERASLWPLWLAAILFSSAFIVVAPYAFPAFALVYAVSGVAGWALGAVGLWYDW